MFVVLFALRVYPPFLSSHVFDRHFGPSFRTLRLFFSSFLSLRWNGFLPAFFPHIILRFYGICL